MDDSLSVDDLLSSYALSSVHVLSLEITAKPAGRSSNADGEPQPHNVLVLSQNNQLWVAMIANLEDDDTDVSAVMLVDYDNVVEVGVDPERDREALTAFGEHVTRVVLSPRLEALAAVAASMVGPMQRIPTTEPKVRIAEPHQ